MHGTTTDRIREALGSVDYPADKWAWVEEATRAGAEEETIRALRAVPQAEYANLNEVVRSVSIDHEREDGPVGAPVNPIVEELGENRGS